MPRLAMSFQTQHDPKNEAEITYWNSAGGRHWVERQQSQDIVLGPILQATLERAQLRQVLGTWPRSGTSALCQTRKSRKAQPPYLTVIVILSEMIGGLNG